MARNDEQDSPACLAIWWWINSFLVVRRELHVICPVISDFLGQFKVSAISISCPMSSKSAGHQVTVHNNILICTCCSQMNQKSISIFSLHYLNGVDNLDYVIALSINEANCTEENAFKMVSIELKWTSNSFKVSHECSRVMPLISEQL